MMNGKEDMTTPPTPVAELDEAFSYHRPKEGQPDKYEQIRDKGKELAYLIHDLCPDSLDRDHAIRKIREAIMWANASIAIHE